MENNSMRNEEPFKINSQGKIRIALSVRAETVLKDDMLSFSFGEFNSFCNHVFTKYYAKANATVSYRLGEAAEGYEKALKVAKNMRASTKKKVVECMINGKVEEAIDNLENNIRYAGENTAQAKEVENKPLYIYFNKGNMGILTEELNEKEEYTFHKNAAGYIREVLEEYTSLSHISREAVVRAEEIGTIEKCIDRKNNKDPDKGSLIRIKMNSKYGEKTYNVIPYKIVSDPLNTRRYLVGYSFEQGQESKKKPASFSIGRLSIKDISIYRRKRISLDENEKKEL